MNELTNFTLTEDQSFSPEHHAELSGHLDDYLRTLLPPKVDLQQGTRDFFAMI
jgi:hypothetical protein